METSSLEDIVDYVCKQWESRTKISFEVESIIEEIVQDSLDADTLLDEYKQYKKESFITKGFTEYNLKKLMDVDYIENFLSDEDRIKEICLRQLIENL